VAGLLSCGVASAGPPYVTDDPAPTDRGQWEIYAFAGGSHVDGSTGGEAGLDVNCGCAPDLQCTVVVPMAYEHSDGFHSGMGVVETALKWEFLHQQEDGARPDVAFFPRVFWPTAPSRFASQHANVLLPLWIGKDFDAWSTFGGGGYQFNPGNGNKDFWLGGIALTRSLHEGLSVGAEVYHRSADATDGHALTALGFGVDWSVSPHWSLLASIGPGLQNASEKMEHGFYVALKADY
jgi:hypothetical protein